MQISAQTKKLIALVIVVLVVGSGFYGLYSTGRNKGYSPEQPIPFSHKLHAGQYNIPCMYCHAGVEKSRHATVPSANICLNCHSQVATDKPNIQKLREYVEKGQQIPWVKVHDLADYVYFNHKRHIAKGVACETCHGDVKEMDRIQQVKPLTMGWCVDCHKGTTAPESLFTKERAYHQPGTKVDPDMPAPAKGSPVAPTNCYTCHR